MRQYHLMGDERTLSDALNEALKPEATRTMVEQPSMLLRFPLPILIPPTAPHSSSSIIWGWYNRPVVAAVPSGLSLTPLTIINKKNPS
jgi:hypothetical protein